MRTIRSSLRLAAAGLAVVLAGACSPSPSQSPGTSAPASSGSLSPAPAGSGLASLIAAARAEGRLTTIALPRTWCNYGAIIDGFTARYGIKVTGLNPDGSFQQELDAITANKAAKGPAAPDVIDVGLTYGPKAAAEGLLAPYKVAEWDDIAPAARDESGYWYGDYYGVISFEVNTKVVTSVPRDWADLLNAAKSSVALAGDPAHSSQAVASVWAAALGNGGSLDNARPGLDFFRKLSDAGIFAPVIARTATVASGQTPIRIAWTYTALADRQALNGNPPITVVVPRSGRLAGMYVQAISAFAPHPNAARLWMEYLYSNEVQLDWLKGFCTPVRYYTMLRAGAIPAETLAGLPDIPGVALPTADQVARATDAVTNGWAATVGVAVK